MAAAAAAAAVPVPSARKMVIMVVDDNEIDRMVAEGFVEDLGYPVVCAESGIDCLQQLHEMIRKVRGVSAGRAHAIIAEPHPI